ncbi:uncharacterized protein [Ptychodera flava]|uniref:uncharacterized protein n=1 Tax=Ptychodera flava TaxID=63121 RepID=UPI00396A9DB0
METLFIWTFAILVCVESGRASRSTTTTTRTAEEESKNEDGTCLLQHTPRLENVYCRDTLQRFEARLDKILEKIELKIDNFDTVKGCRQGWHVNGGYCYYISTQRKSWREARDWCQYAGGADLLSITDHIEAEFLRDKIMNLIPDVDGSVHLWIGLHDINREGVYSWSDEVVLSTSYWKKGMSDFKYTLKKSSNVTVMTPIPDMYAFTLCFWMKSEEDNRGTPVSYATYSGSVNEIVVYDYSRLQLWILDMADTKRNVTANDGLWHHICCTWSSVDGNWDLWKDGTHAAGGTDLVSGQYIRGGGILILGQEQDSVGGTFDQKQAFVGDISQFNLWDLVLEAEAIQSNMADCTGAGNVYAWHTNNVISGDSHDIALLQDICEQPNNFGGHQDCVEIMDGFGYWNDAECERPQRFVCKSNRVPRDCEDVRRQGHKSSGVYYIDPDDRGSFAVYCDMDINGDAYTIFQRRYDMSLDFYRDWTDYKNGFGDLEAEFWLGNDKMNRLTGQRHHELRIDLTNAQGNTAFIVYDYFSVAHENDHYRLRLGHKMDGELPDHLSKHRHQKFTTKDSDNDRSKADNCAVLYEGAWWYDSCFDAELNIKYDMYNNLQWEGWQTPPITGSKMKIKRSDRNSIQ